MLEGFSREEAMQGRGSHLTGADDEDGDDGGAQGQAEPPPAASHHGLREGLGGSKAIGWAFLKKQVAI